MKKKWTHFQQKLRFFFVSYHLNLQRLYRRESTIGILFICMMLTKVINKVRNFLANGSIDKHFRPPPQAIVFHLFSPKRDWFGFLHISRY